MECNVGPTERWVRLVGGGLALGLIPVTGNRWLRVALAVAAAAEIGTALARYCPVNALLGIDHCQGTEPSRSLQLGRPARRVRRLTSMQRNGAASRS